MIWCLRYAVDDVAGRNRAEDSGEGVGWGKEPCLRERANNFAEVAVEWVDKNFHPEDGC